MLEKHFLLQENPDLAVVSSKTSKSVTNLMLTTQLFYTFSAVLYKSTQIRSNKFKAEANQPCETLKNYGSFKLATFS